MNARQVALDRLRKNRDLSTGNEHYFIWDGRDWKPWKDTALALALACEPELDYVVPPTGDAKGTPRVQLTTPALAVNKDGPREITTANLFTLTTKMRCLSFSLPAGVPAVGGTCSMSAASRDDDYICYGCYAIINNYDYANVQFTAAVRLAWVRLLLESGGADEFASVMSRAIETHTNRLRQLRREEKGLAELDYFRIHDAGDVGALDLEFDMDYSRGWWRTAALLPHMSFWLPTRDWTNPAWLRRYEQLVHEVPENLIIRPSALRFEEPAPMLGETLDAGASSGFEPNIAEWNCPAYKSGGSSCLGADCRVCWEEPMTSVNYEPHGWLATRFYKRLGRAIKKNPPMSLEEAWAASEAESPLSDEFLMDVLDLTGNLTDRPISEWVEFLDALGYDTDSINDYLAGIGEWE